MTRRIPKFAAAPMSQDLGGEVVEEGDADNLLRSFCLEIASVAIAMFSGVMRPTKVMMPGKSGLSPP